MGRVDVVASREQGTEQCDLLLGRGPGVRLGKAWCFILKERQPTGWNARGLFSRRGPDCVGFRPEKVAKAYVLGSQ
jgi:hypothetical protein